MKTSLLCCALLCAFPVMLRADAAEKQGKEVLAMRLKNTALQREKVRLELQKKRMELIRKDPVLREKYEALMKLHLELAALLEKDSRIRALNSTLITLDEDMKNMRKQLNEKGGKN